MRFHQIMTPLEDVFTLSAARLMDPELCQDIFARGHSRIPIHLDGQPRAFMCALGSQQFSRSRRPMSSQLTMRCTGRRRRGSGILLVKRLLTYNPGPACSRSLFRRSR